MMNKVLEYVGITWENSSGKIYKWESKHN